MDQPIQPIVDALSRPLKDLRISVTDRCNFRCTYCMPKEIFGSNYSFLPHEKILTFEEIERLVRIFSQLGVEKIRITGGEPLLRKDLEELIHKIALVDTIRDIALTTNASMLTLQRAQRLREAGLKRLTVSLDSLQDNIFGSMNGVRFPVQRVLQGIQAAKEAGFTSVKVNMVVQKGKNDNAIIEMAEYFRGTGHVLRLIEYMDVGTTNGWSLQDVVSANEILLKISSRWPLEPIPARSPNDVAKRYRYLDGEGEIGLITSVTNPFCHGCSRARLSSDGKVYTCLFAADGLDIKTPMREGASDKEIKEILCSLWQHRRDRYSEIRTDATVALPKVEMSRIGG
ncbi:GTP 3',8-cyclase MoaA [Alicyclobacillus tolerans]|uniref:GTP 3',8-cyclase n=1 Tax=Alicyclobacillus tolerans TaxID=90970 RepID=A0A1M6SZF7_9BACL|nr:GTP 3',8-cyclase MoaA [Alicyclobacillus montanus]SHK50047.1 cyclic pyranopterin phosphate synthase [Alicyclobacillus montanus]